jgi:hypothetical protein
MNLPALNAVELRGCQVFVALGFGMRVGVTWCFPNLELSCRIEQCCATLEQLQ